MSPKLAYTAARASWRSSSQVCAYSDFDRHLGHIVRSSDGWLAFDGTHTNPRGNAFRLIGFFHSAEAARAAVEAATRPFCFSDTVV